MEVIICIALIGLTFLTLFWPDNSPSVTLTPGKNSTSKYISKDDFYLCSIDFSNTEWVTKYKKFDCFLEIDGNEYHVLKETVAEYEKNVAFGIPENIFNTLEPGNYKCRIIIRPAYRSGNQFDNNLIETKSNQIILAF